MAANTAQNLLLLALWECDIKIHALDGFHRSFYSPERFCPLIQKPSEKDRKETGPCKPPGVMRHVELSLIIQLDKIHAPKALEPRGRLVIDSSSVWNLIA